MTYQVTKQTKQVIKAQKGEFAKSSLALVRAAASIGLAVRIERVAALSIPAAKRPKVSEIKEAIRKEFGGDEKETNRQAYDLCSLGFRVLSKMESEAEKVVSEAQAKGGTWFEGQVTALAGRATVDAWKAWVTGDKAQAAQKTPDERLTAYFEKHASDVSTETLDKMSEMIVAELARRAQVEQAQAA